MTMTMKKVFATSLSATVLSIGGLALNPVNADAAIFAFQNATLSDGGTIEGSFDFTNGVYSQFDIRTTAGTSVTTGSTYQSPTAVSPSSVLGNPLNSGTQLTVQASDSPTNVGILNFVFQTNLSLLFPGDTSTIQTGAVSPFGATPSYEFYIFSGQNGQGRAVSGGTVVAVPEPLTILGAATAVGFGASFKRRALKNNKKA